MTNKEAISHIRDILAENNSIKPSMVVFESEKEALRVAIEALEQQQSRCDSCIHSEEQDGSNCYECVKGIADNFEAQPCEDCISREAVIEKLKQEEKILYTPTGMNYLIRAIKALPSVTPTRPTGQWIDIDCQSYTWQIKCPFCNHSRSMMSTQGIYPNYCENCGARMEV